MPRIILALLSFLAFCGTARAQNPIIGNGLITPVAGGFLSSCTANFTMVNWAPNSSSFTSGSGWSTESFMVATPTLSTVSDTLPDGTTGNVTQAAYPTIRNGTENYSLINTSLSSIGGANSFTVGFWAKQITSIGTGNLYDGINVGLVFERAAIPNDGNWHLVTAHVPAGTFGGMSSPAVQIGINQFDTVQQGGTPAITIELTGAFIVYDPYSSIASYSYSNVKAGGPLATTGSALTVTAPSIPCPAHVAFRDFLNVSTGLTPYSGNPFLSENTSEVWRSGGVSNPYIQSQFQSGGFYWAMSNCTSSAPGGEPLWMSFCLWKSTDGLHWTEDTTNAPNLLTPGAILAKPAVSSVGSGFTASASGTAIHTGGSCGVQPVIAVTTNSSGQISTATPSPNNGVGTGSCPQGGWPGSSDTNWIYSGVGSGSGASFTFSATKGKAANPTPSWFQLHPAFLPYGCSDGTTAHSFCVLYSAFNSSGNDNIFMAWSDTIDGVYTPLGCAGPGVCSTATPVTYVNLPTGNQLQGLPSIINVGGATGTNYIYVIEGGNNDGPQNDIFSTPASSSTTTSGNTLTYIGIDGLNFGTARHPDWDYAGGSSGFVDPYVYLNHCGFYERFYTSYNGSGNAPFTTVHQIIGYAVSNSPTGPWWKFDNYIIPPRSPMYYGAIYLGDSAVIELNGQFIWTGNYDNGSTVSRAVAATMSQGTCP